MVVDTDRLSWHEAHLKGAVPHTSYNKQNSLTSTTRKVDGCDLDHFIDVLTNQEQILHNIIIYNVLYRGVMTVSVVLTV